MAKKNKKENTQKIPEKYTVKVIKEDRMVDLVFAIAAIAAGLWFLYASIRNFTEGDLFWIFNIVLSGVCFWLGLFYYPRYVFEHVDVEGDTLTFHRTWFRTYTVKFKEITDVYSDGKQKPKNSYFKGSGSHAVFLEFKGGKYRLPCDFTDNWEILKRDLKEHGVAVRK